MNKYVITLDESLITNLHQLELLIEKEGFDIVSAYKFGIMVGYANSDAVTNLKKIKEVKKVEKYLL